MVEGLNKRGRPKHCRRVGRTAVTSRFTPDLYPSNEHIQLGLDELEAIRLTDLEGLYQADAAQLMNISRQTLGRVLKEAHQKVADAIINGKVLNIHGGNVQHQQPAGASKGNSPLGVCPKCKNKEIHKFDSPERSAQCPSCGCKVYQGNS